MEEIFKPLDYRGSHFVVGNLATIYKEGKPAKAHPNHDGYLIIACKHGDVSVHRLVAMCFVDGRSEEANEVNHKDFNRQNNVADNLEWLSHADNIRYSARAGRKGDITGEKNPNFGNRKLSKFYREHPEAAKEKQGRPGTRNGKATAVDVFKDGELIAHFDLLIDCWKYMREEYGWESAFDTFTCGIRRSNKVGRPYKGFTFVTYKKH